MKNKIVTVIYCVMLTLFMLTFAISVPIYCRFLYYIQIKTLGLESATGWSYQVIKEAYDAVLNFCTLPAAEFSAGQLEYSASGAAHFADCKVLFNLNSGVLLCSAAALTAIILLQRFKKISLLSFKGHRPYFWSAIAAIALPIVALAIIAIVGFNEAFIFFHALFFPGKTNFYFDPKYDQIILIMPEQFFINCAIIIGAVLFTFAAALVLTDYLLSRRKQSDLKSAK